MLRPQCTFTDILPCVPQLPCAGDPYRRPRSTCKQTDPEKSAAIDRAGPSLWLCLLSARGRVADPGKCSLWVRSGAWPAVTADNTPASLTAAKTLLVDACPPVPVSGLPLEKRPLPGCKTQPIKASWSKQVTGCGRAEGGVRRHPVQSPRLVEAATWRRERVGWGLLHAPE